MTQQRSTPEPDRPDPFEFWRRFYEANEQSWTKAMKDVMSTQGFAEMQGKMLEAFLGYQKMMRDAMTTQMTSLNLPTRDDIARLGELIVSLEEKVDQLDDRLATVADTVAEEVGKVEQTSRGIEDKVSQYGKRIGAVESALTRETEKTERGSQEAPGEGTAPSTAPKRQTRSRSSSAHSVEERPASYEAKPARSETKRRS